MSDPQTTNIGLSIPARGSDSGTWDVPVNGDFVALDGLFGGVVSVALSSAPVTLTAPAGFTASPSAGPTQSQNAVIKLTGALSANVQVTLPAPGYYIIDNQTTGNFVATLASVGVGSVISPPVGAQLHIYNDGTNVKFVNLGKPGDLEFFAGLSALPTWVTACTVAPYLLTDGSIYNFSTYPALGPRLAGAFGGNGITTFGVPDLRGRNPLSYDGTGTRITTAGCGINGQTIGASGGTQNTTLIRTDLPNVAATVAITDPGHTHLTSRTVFASGLGDAPQSGAGAGTGIGSITALANVTGITASVNLNGGVTQTLPNNVPPAQVAGIWCIKT